ncbi:MAG TPA: hypothetical protein VGN83_09230 [Falsiroseomonas sp.]|jgi:hypothetical protein|nr:hypothetical protein [Falsiroseomonas sp.]
MSNPAKAPVLDPPSQGFTPRRVLGLLAELVPAAVFCLLAVVVLRLDGLGGLPLPAFSPREAAITLVLLLFAYAAARAAQLLLQMTRQGRRREAVLHRLAALDELERAGGTRRGLG